MNQSIKLITVILCLLLSFSMISCSFSVPGGSSTSDSKPEATPGGSSPTVSEPTVPDGSSTPDASESAPLPPASSSPTESSPDDPPGKEESTSTEPGEGTEPESIYVYTSLPDAFTELSNDTRAAIETAVGTSVNWDKHYLGTHKGYIIFGTYDESDPKIYIKNDRYFGKLTQLYGYKDGELRTFRSLTEDMTVDLELLSYISYLGLKKEVGRLPVASEELSAETISKIKEEYKYFENNYFGKCGGYIIFVGQSNIADGYRGGIRKIQNHVLLDYTSVKAYSPEGGFEDFFTLCNKNLDIDYCDIVDTILIAACNGARFWIPVEHIIKN